MSKHSEIHIRSLCWESYEAWRSWEFIRRRVFIPAASCTQSPPSTNSEGMGGGGGYSRDSDPTRTSSPGPFWPLNTTFRVTLIQGFTGPGERASLGYFPPRGEATSVLSRARKAATEKSKLIQRAVELSPDLAPWAASSMEQIHQLKWESSGGKSDRKIEDLL